MRLRVREWAGLNGSFAILLAGWVLSCASAKAPPVVTAQPVTLATHTAPPTVITAAAVTAPAPSSAPTAPAAVSLRPRSAHERGWLGVELAKREPGEPGVLVRDVVRGSPAASAGLLARDVITSVDGENVARPEDVSSRVGAHGAGERVAVGILREQATRLIAVELEAFPDNNEILRKQFVGLHAPEFTGLQTAQGSLAPSLAALRGKVVVLEFWASWCPPCHLLSPVLQTWHERFAPQGAVVLGVAAETVPVVSHAAYELGVQYPLFADPTEATTKSYRAFALPTVFVLDKGGTVRDVMVGYSTPGLDQLETLVKHLLEES